MQKYATAWLVATNAIRTTYLSRPGTTLKNHLDAAYIQLVLAYKRNQLSTDDLREAFTTYLERDLKAVKDTSLSVAEFTTYNVPLAIPRMPLRVCLELTPDGIYKLEYPGPA